MAECYISSYLEAFPHLGCRFLGGTTLFVLPALWSSVCFSEPPFHRDPLKAPDPAPSQEPRQPPLCVILTSHLPYIIIRLR